MVPLQWLTSRICFSSSQPREGQLDCLPQVYPKWLSKCGSGCNGICFHSCYEPSWFEERCERGEMSGHIQQSALACTFEQQHEDVHTH